MKKLKMKISEELIEKYIDKVLGDMSLESKTDVLRESMLETYKHIPGPDILMEIEDRYPELLVAVSPPSS